MKQIFVVMSVPKFVKLSGDLRDTKIQNTAPVEVVVVFQLAGKQLCADVLLRIVGRTTLHEGTFFPATVFSLINLLRV